MKKFLEKNAVTFILRMRLIINGFYVSYIFFNARLKRMSTSNLYEKQSFY